MPTWRKQRVLIMMSDVESVDGEGGGLEDSDQQPVSESRAGVITNLAGSSMFIC